MSEIVNALIERRSIRSFKQEQIADIDLETILKAGQFAPSAKGEQRRQLTVVQDPEVLSQINAVIQDIFLHSSDPALVQRGKAPNFSPFYHAPTLIIVAVDEKAIAPEADGSLVLGNLFLAAHALGIGSCWIHSLRALFDSPDGRALNARLAIPPGYRIIGSGAFGYNAGEPPAAAARPATNVTIVR